MTTRGPNMEPISIFKLAALSLACRQAFGLARQWRGVHQGLGCWRDVQPAGRRPGVLGGRDRLVGWDLGVAVSLGFPRLAVDEGGRAAVGAGR
jgi:hypothetical protein